MKQKLNKEKREEFDKKFNESIKQLSIADIYRQVDELEDFFTTSLFQNSQYFSEEIKQNMKTELKQLQKELEDQIANRVAKYEAGKQEKPIDFSDLKPVIAETQKLIGEVLEPLVKGFDLNNQPVQGFPIEIKRLKVQVEQKLKDYANDIAKLDDSKNDTDKLSVGKKVFLHIFALMRTAVEGIKEFFCGSEAENTARQESSHNYPIKNAVNRFAQSIQTPTEFTRRKVCIIGPPAVGKTAIYQRLQGGDFPKNYGSTADYDYVALPNGIDLLTMNVSPVSERSAKVQARELQSVDAIMIALDAETLIGEGENDPVEVLRQYWDEAKRHAPRGTPVQLVITKMDFLPEAKHKDLYNCVKKVVENSGIKRINLAETIYCSAKNSNDNGISQIQERLQNIAKFENPVRGIDRICILGPEKSGKTQLIKQLSNSQAEFDENYQPTQGINHTFLSSNEIGNNKSITEIVGNDGFESTAKSYLNKADIVFVTLDGMDILQNSEEKTLGMLTKYKNWVETFAAEGTEICLVVTKWDQVFDQITQNLPEDSGYEEQQAKLSEFRHKTEGIAQKAGIDTDLVAYTSAAEKMVEEVKEIISPEQQENMSLNHSFGK